MRALLLLPLFLFACGTGDDGDDLSVIDSGVTDMGPPPDSGVFPGQVVVSTDTLDLGAIVLTSANQGTFTVTNPGRETVQVALSQTAGPDAARFVRSVNVPETDGKFRLEPSGVATVTVVGTPEEEGPLLAVLALDSCAGGCPIPVLVIAEGVLSGVTCPAEVDLGLANPGGCIARKIDCTNQGNATERITAVELEPASDAAFALADPALPIDLAPAATASFDVTYCPEALGTNQGEITLATFTPFQTEHSIRLTGRAGGADLACEPAAIDFGSVGVGASVIGTVRCTNGGVEAAQVSAALVNGGEFGLLEPPATIAPGETGAFEVVLAPTSPGTKQDTLRITSNDPDSPQLEVGLTAEALMVDPCAAVLEPAAIDLGLVGLGDGRAARFFVRNTGSTVCLIRDVSLAAGSGADLRLLDPPPPGATIEAQSTQAIDVELAPQSSGTVNGTLLVAFTNPGTSELSAAVSAVTGVTPVVVDPPLIDFGPSPLGCAAPRAETVRIRRISTGTGSVLNIQVQNDPAGAFAVVATTPRPLLFWEEMELTVTFDPQAAGTHTAELQIITDASPTPIIVPIAGDAVTETIQIDSAVLAPRMVDLLFVVDDSETMANGQAALAQALGELEQIRSDRQADLRAAVITTDFENPARSGRFQGTPAVLDGASPTFVADLAERVMPGIDGAFTEMGIAALGVALVPPLVDLENAGFLRPGADLAVVVLSDDDDYSPSAPSIASVVATLRRASGGRLFVAGLVGPPTARCEGPLGSANVADRWAQLFGRVQGNLPTSYCGDMAVNMRLIGEQLFGSASVSLRGRPVIGSIAVEVDGTPLAGSAWSYDLSTNRVVIADPSDAPIGATVEVTYPSVCLSATCGNGATDPGEECDDQNGTSTDACIACADAVCGDGLTRGGVEGCDDGNLFEGDACLPGCETASCGDGALLVGVETCDDGNNLGGDGCPATCRFYQPGALVSEAFVPLTVGATLTPAGGGQDPYDDGLMTVVLPFDFFLFDVPSSTLTVSVNGFVATGGVGPMSWVNENFPTPGEPDGTMAVWWDDLYLDEDVAGGASISWAVLGAAPDRVAVIEWRDLRLQDQESDNHRRFTFQLQLEESGVIRFAYADTETAGTVPTAASASGGIENQTASRGFEALGCSPNCNGRPRPQSADGFPAQSTVTFTP